MGTNDEDEGFLVNSIEALGKNWTAHDDNDGRLFYYNHTTKQSVWEIPSEFKHKEGDLMMKLMLVNALARSGKWTAHDAGHGTLYYFNEKTRESTWNRPQEWGNKEQEEEYDRQQKQQAMVDEENRIDTKKDKKKKKKKKKGKKKEEAVEEEKEEVEEEEEEEEEDEEEAPQADPEEAKRRLEEQLKSIQQFRKMLRDKKIMPFTKWAVGLPRIAVDPRFLAIPTMDERRQIFEDFVKNRQSDLKSEKKERLKAAKKKFSRFLQDQNENEPIEEQTVTVYLAALKKTKEDLYDQLTKDCLEFLTIEQQEQIFKEKLPLFQEAIEKEKTVLTSMLENAKEKSRRWTREMAIESCKEKSKEAKIKLSQSHQDRIIDLFIQVQEQSQKASATSEKQDKNDDKPRKSRRSISKSRSRSRDRASSSRRHRSSPRSRSRSRGRRR